MVSANTIIAFSTTAFLSKGFLVLALCFHELSAAYGYIISALVIAFVNMMFIIVAWILWANNKRFYWSAFISTGVFFLSIFELIFIGYSLHKVECKDHEICYRKRLLTACVIFATISTVSVFIMEIFMMFYPPVKIVDLHARYIDKDLDKYKSKEGPALSVSANISRGLPSEWTVTPSMNYNNTQMTETNSNLVTEYQSSPTQTNDADSMDKKRSNLTRTLAMTQTGQTVFVSKHIRTEAAKSMNTTQFSYSPSKIKPITI